MTFRFTGGSTEAGVVQVFDKFIETPLFIAPTPYYLGGVTGSGVVIKDVTLRTVKPYSVIDTVLVYGQVSGTTAATINFITGALASGSNYESTGSQTSYSGLARLNGGDELFISINKFGSLGPPSSLTSSFDVSISYYATSDGSKIN